MIDLFSQIEQNAITKISHSNDRELFKEDFEKNVLEYLKFKCPTLIVESTSTEIKEETIGFHNAPYGSTFSPGQKMEIALIKVPVEGKIDLLNSILKMHHYSNENMFLKSNEIIYREASTKIITGNKDLIESIKQNAKNNISGLQSILKSFENSVNDFFENKLKHIVQTAIQYEREKRNSKSETEKKLNPFL